MDIRWSVYLFTLLVLCLSYASLCSAEDAAASHEESSDEDELVVQRWKETFERIRKMIGSGIKMAMPYFMSSMYDKDLQLSNECRRALFQWIADIRAMKPWALEMGDASAKVIDGMLTGTLSSFGAYDQCLDTVNPKGTIKGQYCSVEVWPKLPPKPRFYQMNKRLDVFKQFENDTGIMGEFTKSVQLFYMFPLRLGICMPSPCSTLDMSNITSLVSKSFASLNVTVPRCEIRERAVIENYQIPMLCAIAILIILVVIGTLYDQLIFTKLNPDSPKSVLSECLMAFSVFKNWNQLMDIDAGSEDLSVLHGIRFLSMCWIILGHTYFHLNFNLLRYLQVTIDLISHFVFNTVTNASLVVDNFFFFSGLLLVYVTMDMMKVIGKVPRVIYFILHRLWRFLPIMMFFVGCSTLLPLIGDGPTWHENIDPIVEGCKKDWWANMIFINNLYRSTDSGCLGYSWYLAADFQIYVFSIPIAILIISKPRIGLTVNFVVMILSIIGVAVQNYVRDLPPTMLFVHVDIEQRTNLMRETYYRPYQHLAPACIGLFVGYFFQTHKKPIKIHWALNLAAWLGSIALTSSALFGVHPWNRGYTSGTGKIASLLYASLSRVGWTIGVAWVTVACTKGCGGVISNILRWNAFIPLSRLTFLVYMIHPLVQFTFYSTMRNGIQAMNHYAIFICFSFIIASYGIAFPLALIVESPCLNLGKIVFRRREAWKKRNRALSVRNNQVNSSPTRKSSDWRSELVPELVNGNGKCNGDYDFRSDVADEVVIRTSSKRNGNTRGDFVCHL